jgi:putative ABC transport system ATP-binding protein
MSIGHTLLGLLESGPRHGYDLKRAFDEKFGHDRPLHYGQVYSTMSRLLKNGLVEVDGIEPGGGPERKRYAITDAGITDVQRWLATPEKPEPYLQSTLYTKVVLALLTHRNAGDILDNQRAEHLRMMRILTDRKRKGDLADQLICDHALFHLEADLRWLELTAARLDKLAEVVVKTYGPTVALDGAEFSIHPGEVVAVMGPSGSGKSTLLHCLAGIVTPDSGSITYNGREMATMNDAERSALRRSEFGFVFQFGQLVPELTCVENVALPLRLNGRSRKEAEKAALAWMERLEVDDLRKKRPGEVSGGQGQRVAVARSLVTNPRVLFADEPTGALDSLNGERVMDLLTEAARSTNAAVVLVTHEARVAAYSDREIVVRDGKSRDMERVV